MYTGVPVTERVATRDVVLPLAHPITTTTGKRITELPIRKGQFVYAAMASYNRSADLRFSLTSFSYRLRYQT